MEQGKKISDVACCEDGIQRSPEFLVVESYGTVSQIFPGGERYLSRKEDLPVAAKRLDPNIRRAILRNALRSALHEYDCPQ